MHVTIRREELARAVGAVGRVVESRNIIPVLSSLKLVAEGETLQITATDLGIVATVRAAAQVLAPGAVCVEAKLLGDIAKKAGAADVALAMDDDKLVIKSGRSKFSLATLSAADFPSLDGGTYDAEFTADLSAMFAPLSFAIGNDSSREMLSGVFLHTRDGKLVAVATDGHRLARVRGDEVPTFEGVIIPNKAVGVIPKGECSVSISSEKVRIAGDDVIIVTKLIGLQFPDYERVIPSANSRCLTVDRDEMMRAADRVVTVSSQKSKGVKLSIAPGSVLFSARSDIGTAEDEVAAEYSGEPMDYGLNSAYLRDMMNAVPPGQVTLALSGDYSPAYVTCANDNWDGVLMPLRVA